jgi:hypothetical protein
MLGSLGVLTEIAMNSFARAFMSLLLLVAAGIGAGCSGSGLETGSTSAAADAPPGAGGKVARRGDERFNQDKFWEEMKTRGSQ